VQSIDANVVTDTSTDATFNTTELVISGVSASAESNNATVTWTTDDASSSQVEYGTTTSYGLTTTLDTTKVTSHSVLVKDVPPGAIIHYRVKSDSGTDTAASADATITTNAAVRVTLGVLELMDDASPILVQGTADCLILSRVYEPLMANSGDGEALPWLALSTSWDEPTLTYTINLNPNATFSDGSSVTATDVKFSWDKAWEYATPGGADTIGFMKKAAGSTAEAPIVASDALTIVDADTVTFTLAEKNATFLNDLNGVYILPEHIWAPILAAQQAKSPPETLETYVNTDPVGSGPFLWANYTEQSHVLLQRNPDYWGGPMNEVAKIDEVVFKLYGTDEAMLLALQAGEIDIVNDVGLYSQIPALVGNTDVEVGIDDSANYFKFLYMNLRKEPNDVLEFRQAVDMAIDKEDLIAFSQFGYGSIAPLVPLVPAPLVSANVTWPGVGKTDAERITAANALLDAITGMSATPAADSEGVIPAFVRTYNGTDIVFTLKTQGDPIGVTNADLIKDDLAEIGITANVEVVGTWPLIVELFFGDGFDDWDITVFGHGATPGIQGLVQEYGADPWNVWYDSSAIGWGELGPEGDSGAAGLAAQAKLRELRREADPTAFAALAEQAQLLFAADLPIVVLYQGKLAYAYRNDRLTGWNPTDLFDGFGSSGFLGSNPNLVSLDLK
jgi:peptide/nickel transport system substrate-binding protein